MKATRLRTEYLTEPLGLGCTAPRFSWNCDGGIKQTAYQITCLSGQETIWDSGKVQSSSMTHIPCGGRALRSRQRVIWRVRLWDENGKCGETASSWFEMGLLEETDWKGKWITGDYRPNPKRRYPVDHFCKRFLLEKGIQSARLYASAQGVYDVTINGRRMEDFILAPGMTDYRKRIQYQTYDVTKLLSRENTMEIRLADGWYRGSCAAYGMTNVYGKQTGVMAQLEVTCTDGSVETVCTDESWSWSNDGPIRFADLQDGEIVDSMRKPTFSGSAKTVKRNVNLVASDNVPVRQKERFRPKRLPNRVLDFGQNIAGFLEFTVKGKPGQVLQIVLGEVLDEHGNVDLSGIQESRPAAGWNQFSLIRKLTTNQISGENDPTPRQQIVFTCSGGEDHYKTGFAIFGFRYAQILSDFDPDPAAFSAIAVYSDMERTGSFTCSNELLNKLVENTLWSMKGNFLELPTDCPTRERLGWTGDAQIFFDTGAYLMDTAPFFRKWLRDMEDAQRKNGLLPAVLPYQGVEMMYNATGASVGWADAVYLIPYRFYKRYGDRTVLEQSYPMMKKYTDYVLSHLGMTDKNQAKNNPYNAFTYEKGMHLGEWLEPEEFQEKISSGNRPKHPEEATAYLHLTMTTMAEIARILDKPEEAAAYEKVADGAQKAYDHLFVETGTLDTDRQAKLVRPLALGLLEGEKKQAAEKRLVEAVKKADYCVGTGFLSTVFLLPVMTEAGEAETAYRMLENTKKPSWLGEVLDGATTIWENWEGTLSQNHYSPGAVCQWLFETVGGIRIAGENRFRIAPVPGGSLTYIKTSYLSPYGLVKTEWENHRLIVTVPANTVADITLPNGRSMTVEAGTYAFSI